MLAGGASNLPAALTEGFQSAFLAGSVIAALGFVATLILIRSRDSRAGESLLPFDSSRFPTAQPQGLRSALNGSMRSPVRINPMSRSICLS